MKNLITTEAQEQAIQYLVYSEKTKTEIAKIVGVRRETIYRWYSQPAFKKRLDEERKNKFYVYADVAQKELVKMLKDKSDKRTQLQAIKMVLGENGYCTDRTQVDINPQGEIKITISNDEDDDI